MPWQSDFPQDVQVCAVQLPGRGARYQEAPITDFVTLVPQVARAVAELSDLPCVFFGHSLGALIAFEVAHQLRELDCVLPEHFVASAANSPSSAPTSHSLAQIESDDEFIEHLRRYGGTPESLLENRELMALLIPAIRADFKLLDSYRYRSRYPLAIPVSVFAGRDDSLLSESGLASWGIETEAMFKRHWLDGGHFYFQQSKSDLMDALGAVVKPLLLPRYLGNPA